MKTKTSTIKCGKINISIFNIKNGIDQIKLGHDDVLLPNTLSGYFKVLVEPRPAL